MSKNIIKSLFTKDNKYENYVLLVISIIAIVFGILSITGVFEIKTAKVDNPLVLGIIFTVLGIITLFFSVYGISKERKLSKLVAYKELLELFESKKINEKFSLLGLEYPLVTEHLEALNTIMITVKVTEHLDFVLTVERDSYSFSGDIDENYEYTEEDEEINKVYDLGETVTIDENTNASAILEKFYNFIVFNESLLKELDSKYGDKFAKVE